MTKKIGFIGQGYIGKNYADDFEERGFEVVRYATKEPYKSNGGKIKECDVVFIAVPTPTTPSGFDSSVVKSVLPIVGEGKIAVIKSTVIPGTTEKLQEENKHCMVLCSPEFLSESTAREDARNPFSNIVGIPERSGRFEEAAALVHSILPKAPFTLTCTSREAELIKYAHNSSGYVQVVLFNLIYNLAQKIGADWKTIEKAIEADVLVCNRYSKVTHKKGRGAGGHCFIKDFAALREFYKNELPEDKSGLAALESFEKENIDLLKSTNKDTDLLKDVYGP
ncbi:MAG: UDP-glucose/GDP-mannose dehydrogenase dimerization [Parcubacteria group bacterium Gr01-1014_107]|nr:MAG: UDP-glucose/GDP-mannose dehydrogenase dimerization [Parcubacteria group bacterium Gr01-1014_107]